VMAGLGVPAMFETADARAAVRSTFTHSTSECKSPGWVDAHTHTPKSVSARITAASRCHGHSGLEDGQVRAWIHDSENGGNYGSSWYQSFAWATGMIPFNGIKVTAYVKLGPSPSYNRFWHETFAYSSRVT